MVALILARFIGVSYSTLTLDGRFGHPTDELPMGVEWPGFPYSEDEMPNYVCALELHRIRGTSIIIDHWGRY